MIEPAKPETKVSRTNTRVKPRTKSKAPRVTLERGAAVPET